MAKKQLTDLVRCGKIYSVISWAYYAHVCAHMRVASKNEKGEMVR